MQRLDIYQSLWAMERRHTDGHERSLAENIAMIAEAGLGVAFHAKPKVAEMAPARIDRNDLTALLYVQGYRKADFAA